MFITFSIVLLNFSFATTVASVIWQFTSSLNTICAYREVFLQVELSDNKLIINN